MRCSSCCAKVTVSFAFQTLVVNFYPKTTEELYARIKYITFLTLWEAKTKQLTFRNTIFILFLYIKMKEKMDFELKPFYIRLYSPMK